MGFSFLKPTSKEISEECGWLRTLLSGGRMDCALDGVASSWKSAMVSSQQSSFALLIGKARHAGELTGATHLMLLSTIAGTRSAGLVHCITSSPDAASSRLGTTVIPQLLRTLEQL